MGLAICQAIVAAHCGTITALNNPEGGATFCVNLRCSWSTNNPAVRKALSRVLRGEAWNVDVFASVEALLVRADRVADGCLVLDVTMPGLDGLELQQRLIQAGKAMPIIFVTGHGDIPMTVQALKGALRTSSRSRLRRRRCYVRCARR